MTCVIVKTLLLWNMSIGRYEHIHFFDCVHKREVFFKMENRRGKRVEFYPKYSKWVINLNR